MPQIESDFNFLSSFYEKTATLHSSLSDVLKSKELIQDHFLASKGFIIKRYELKNINNADISSIKKNLQNFISNEELFKNMIVSNKQKLKNISLYYLDRNEEINLDPEKLLVQFNNAVYNARLAVVRLNQLADISKTKKEQDSDIKIKLSLSLERMLNQVIILTSVIEQTYKYTTKIIELLTPFDLPVVYGRAMGKTEFESTTKSNRLLGNKSLVPVFDCPITIQNKIIKMDKDERKTFFKKIGVTDSSIILIFRTKTKPVNLNTPIPQSNGLKEFKFMNGTEIEILKAA